MCRLIFLNSHKFSPHSQKAGRSNKKCFASIHDNTVENDSLCFYAISGSNQRRVQTAIIEYMKILKLHNRIFKKYLQCLPE